MKTLIYSFFAFALLAINFTTVSAQHHDVDEFNAECLVPDMAITALSVKVIQNCPYCPKALKITGAAKNKSNYRYVSSGSAYIALAVQKGEGQGTPTWGLKYQKLGQVGPGETVRFSHVEPLPLKKDIQKPIFHLSFQMNYDPAATPTKFDDDCLRSNNKKSYNATRLVYNAMQ